MFNDIAQEAIEFCRQSLKVAADQIIANSSPDSITHGQLFLIQHLLVLKDMVAQLGLRLAYRNSQTQPELGEQAQIDPERKVSRCVLFRRIWNGIAQYICIAAIN